MKSSTKPQDTPTEPMGPARETDDYAQTRHISTRAGSKMAWERLAGYEKEFRLGHLFCREKSALPSEMWTELRAAFGTGDFGRIIPKLDQPSKNELGRALARRDAAKAFDEGWAICNASWPGGGDMDRVRVVGCPGSFVDVQRDTKNYWRRVEKQMGTNDWMICRRVCGEGYKVAETVVAIQPGYRDSTLARFREALDALVIGAERARHDR